MLINPNAHAIYMKSCTTPPTIEVAIFQLAGVTLRRSGTRGALLEEPDDLVALDLVVLEHGELDLLLLVLDLLGGGVLLLLALLTTTADVDVLHKVDGVVFTDELSDGCGVFGLDDSGPEGLEAVGQAVKLGNPALDFGDSLETIDVDNGGAAVEKLDENLSALHGGIASVAQFGLAIMLLSKPKLEREI
ncbi:hypothetical protein BOVATA_001850 [Babesia ovata]|uniref:Uncharacterized protein n=1 Tax=Babesia ovata TaxID=189622 RepID=A0A2H6K6T9_9APIC|nr:uncharacterized protein BOVATA_001850 [Babesia ovata]GBE58692.1 hypothetical protein BOVATA_001850 [Babesia ovata]